MYAAFQYANMEDLVTTENASSQISTVNPGPYVLVNLGGGKKNIVTRRSLGLLNFNTGSLGCGCDSQRFSLCLTTAVLSYCSTLDSRV